MLLLSLKSLLQKVARSSLMQADRLRAAKTLSSCFLEQRRGCHRSRSNPVALPSDLLLLYVFSCSEHLTKDNLFGCLMLRHWLVEDYMRWSSDLWRLVVGWSKYVWVCVNAFSEHVFECVCSVPGLSSNTDVSCLPPSSQLLQLWQ